MTKITRKTALEMAISALSNDINNTYTDGENTFSVADAVAVLNKMVEQLSRENTRERKPTAKQVANEDYKDLIVNALADGEPHSISDIQQTSDVLMALSGQRLSAIITLLKHEGKVERIEVKRKAYFVKVA